MLRPNVPDGRAGPKTRQRGASEQPIERGGADTFQSRRAQALAQLANREPPSVSGETVDRNALPGLYGIGLGKAGAYL